MPTVNEHLKKPVVASSDGKKMGKIKDLYLDANVTKVTSAYMGKKGLFRRKMMIDRSNVQTVGVDVWLASESEDLVDSRKIEGNKDFILASELKGRKIVSEGGTEIATVDSVILDDQCNVKGFTVGNVPAAGPIADRKTIARAAITSIGSKTSPMTTILSHAETMEVIV